jgi:protein-S-isoprenylcysteine O-methyltransferase Ste14
MGLDLRLPIGALFTALGLVLVVYGVISDASIYARSLGINVNLAWGCVLLAFGLAMLVASWRRNMDRGSR